MLWVNVLHHDLVPILKYTFFELKLTFNLQERLSFKLFFRSYLSSPEINDPGVCTFFSLSSVFNSSQIQTMK